jgi:hypothetical protein
LEHHFLAVALHQLGNSTLAQARGSDLSPEIADHQCRGATVGRNDRFYFLDGVETGHYFYRRQVQPFLKNLPRIAGAAARHGAADIALVRHIRSEADPLAAVKDGCQHSHIRRMRTTAEIRMIGDEGVAFRNIRWRKSF